MVDLGPDGRAEPPGEGKGEGAGERESDGTPSDTLDASLDRIEGALEHRLVPPDVDELADAHGLRALRVAADLVQEETPGTSTARRIVQSIVSFGIVGVIFVLVLPAVSGAEYSEIWDELQTLRGWQLATLTAVWLTVMWTYTGVLSASLPGLRRSQALTVNFAGSAVSNVVPFGGAVGVGATYAMARSWGFDVPSTTRAILVSGFWNVLAKLGIPAAALVLLSFSGQATAALVLAALIGVVVLVAAIVVATAVLRSDRLATKVGTLAERATDAALRLIRRPPVSGLPERLVEFRHDSAGLIRTAWRRLTFWMVVYTLGQYVLLLLCVRMLGATTDELGWVEVFAAFAFGRLLSTIPLTPSGVGFAETGSVAALVAFGAPEQAAAAAVLLFSGFTYLAEIPLGLVGWGVWAAKDSWRRPVHHDDATDS